MRIVRLVCAGLFASAACACVPATIPATATESSFSSSSPSARLEVTDFLRAACTQFVETDELIRNLIVDIEASRLSDQSASDKLDFIMNECSGATILEAVAGCQSCGAAVVEQVYGL